jgi:antitoxin component of MazEF toxin-antitoxin module
MRIQKKLQRAGGCSLAVVIPKIWLAEQGNLNEVELQLGRTLILVIPATTKAGRKTEVIADVEGFDPKVR